MLYRDSSGAISSQAPTVSFLDHGFLFGDSLYEVARTYDGRFFTWTEHMERFVESGRLVGIEIATLLSEIKSGAIDLLKKLGERDAVVRIIVTRGVGKLHIDPRSCLKPLIYMAAWKFEPKLFSQPARLYVSKIQRNAKNTMDPSIKSGNYLNNILAFKEAVDAGYDDALMLNPFGHVTELTTSNVGWIRGDTICTPSDSCGILKGITRRVLFEIANVEQKEYQAEALETCDEMFVLSTLKEVLPVSAIRLADGKIREWKSSPKTLELRKKFQAAVSKRLENEGSVL